MISTTYLPNRAIRYGDKEQRRVGHLGLHQGNAAPGGVQNLNFI